MTTRDANFSEFYPPIFYLGAFTLFISSIFVVVFSVAWLALA